MHFKQSVDCIFWVVVYWRHALIWRTITTTMARYVAKQQCHVTTTCSCWSYVDMQYTTTLNGVMTWSGAMAVEVWRMDMIMRLLEVKDDTRCHGRHRYHYWGCYTSQSRSIGLVWVSSRLNFSRRVYYDERTIIIVIYVINFIQLLLTVPLFVYIQRFRIKSVTIFSTITLTFLGRVLYFLHQWKPEWMLQNEM